jgi:N-carbamoylputrescine amidase
MKVSYVESPEGLLASGAEWQKLEERIASENPDVFVTNEMPFGNWLAGVKEYDAKDAQGSISAHKDGLDALKQLNVPTILSSRPVPFEGKLANEAFVLVNGEYKFAHQKHYFPEEPGYYETDWFSNAKPGFGVVEANGLVIGVLLCTELFFNEWARSYGRQGAHLIVVQRATEQTVEHWKTAAAMAAIVSGCYVVSSNRVGKFDEDLIFGGKGFAFAPDGSLISETSSDKPVVSIDLDFDFIKDQQKKYPCYVREV